MTSVVFMIATDPEGQWISYPGGRVNRLFENLVRGQAYYIKVLMTGVKNQSVSSDYVVAYAA